MYHQNTKRNVYFYTMEMINRDHRFGDIIEIHGGAQGPFKRITPIEIAGEGDGTLSWKENGTLRKKKYEAIVGYKTYATTYVAENGDAIHVVTRAKDTQLTGAPSARNKHNETGPAITRVEPISGSQ